ncbi:hypothetical protein AJ87_35550 [Rhizobium yanglingense]|nr:hypothetical protein AJ87_35550 [Rhizobium yanglingense]
MKRPPFTAITSFSSGRVTVSCNHNHACVADVAGKTLPSKPSCTLSRFRISSLVVWPENICFYAGEQQDARQQWGWRDHIYRPAHRVRPSWVALLQAGRGSWKRHQPLGLISPATISHAFGLRKWVHPPHRRPLFGEFW